MAANKKLTSVIGGRTVRGGKSTGSVLFLNFDDGSNMWVKTAVPADVPIGLKVHSVTQSRTDLGLASDDGKTVELQTAEPTSSVMVRDKSGALEYAD